MKLSIIRETVFKNYLPQKNKVIWKYQKHNLQGMFSFSVWKHLQFVNIFENHHFLQTYQSQIITVFF